MGGLFRWTLSGVAILAALAIAVPFLLPLVRFIPELERIASEKLGQPVEMLDLRVHLLPTPRLVARGIRVGKKAEVTVGELEIAPDFMSLLAGQRAMRLIRADRVEVQEAALAMLGRMPKGEVGTPVRVRRLVMTDVKLNHSTVKLPRFDIDVALGQGLRLVHAQLKTADGTLKLQLDSAGNIALTAKNWTLPAGPPLTFEALAVEGTLKGDQLDLAKIEGLLYGGKIAGSARANWTKQWQVSGKANLAGVDLVPVQKAFGKQAKLSGRLKADAAFSTRAKGPAELREALAIDGPFEVVGGVYQGVDLAKAGDITGQRSAGEATTFEELRGRLQLRGKQVNLSELCVRSPKVVAGGNVAIAPDQKLSGKLDVSVAKTGGFVGVPVSLGGTTDDPSYTPSKGYVIGAVIGTVLMPVIGTTIGSSLGGRIDGVNSGCR